MDRWLTPYWTGGSAAREYSLFVFHVMPPCGIICCLLEGKLPVRQQKFVKLLDKEQLFRYTENKGSGTSVPIIQQKVTVSGKREVTNVELAEEAVDPDDIDTLQDLIVAAVNEAMRQVDEASSQSMGKLAGGLGGSLGGLGGGFPF